MRPNIQKISVGDSTVYLCRLPEAPTKREREILGERQLLCEAFGHDVILRHNPQGAPYIDGKHTYISLSHTKENVCLAVNEHTPIGIDLEHISDRIHNVKQKMFSPSQLAQLSQFNSEAHTSILTLMWCTKEAVFKAEGRTAGYLGENVPVEPHHFLNNSFRLATRRYMYGISQVDIAGADEVCVLARQISPSANNVEQLLADHRKLLALLVDPDKTTSDLLPQLRQYCSPKTPDIILVGGSGLDVSLDDYVDAVKQLFPSTPVVLFPGSTSQFTAKADALMFLSVISGRNAECIIGQQVAIARKVKESGITTLPMGYILIDGGIHSSVEKATHTQALRQDNPQLIVDTAIAGELLGMRLIYLEAGSGADIPVGNNIIRGVRLSTDVYLIVGGGIRTPEQMKIAFEAGADMVVIGNHFEQHPEQIQSFIDAIDSLNEKKSEL